MSKGTRERVAVRQHRDPLELPLSVFLQESLPIELKAERVTRLQSTGYLSDAKLARLETLIADHVKPTEYKQAWLADLGCGNGLLGEYLAKAARRSYVGLDNVHLQGRRRARRLVAGTIEQLPLRAGSVDIVIAIDALYLVHEVARALREAHRILTQGGVLIMSVYSRRDQTSPERDSQWWRNVLKDSGFKILEWHDSTREWRSTMTKKHVARLKDGPELIRRFGSEANPWLEVSVAMLGIAYRGGFLHRTSHWEIAARARAFR